MTLKRAIVASLTVGASVLSVHAQTPPSRWVATWTASSVGRPQVLPTAGPPPPAPFMPNTCPPPTNPPPPFSHITNQTMREVVHVSLGGSRARVVLSNQYGTTPLMIGAAHIALRTSEDGIQAATGGPLTFSGRKTITIPANAVAYSDPVAVSVPPLSDVVVDIYVPGTTDTAAPLTLHNAAAQTNYISETGNHAGAARFPRVATIRSWFLLSRVEVAAPTATGVVVAVGDSITDGTASAPDTNTRWPDILAKRLPGMAVVNAGIGGNRLLSEGAFQAGINALARYETDVLSQPGVTHVVVLEGINDIGNARQSATPTAEDLIAAHKQLIERAHAKGLKIIGATLTPFWGANYYTEVGEAKRQAVNQWIRTGKAYDGVIDFDKATRDPNDPQKYLAAYDSCDHLHPNSAGYTAMGESIDLGLFRTNHE